MGLTFMKDWGHRRWKARNMLDQILDRVRDFGRPWREDSEVK